MQNNLNRLLIENTLRKTINQIKTDPERGIRNAVDMALNFSNGRFQKHFLTMVQRMLTNQHSCYYRMIPDHLAHIDTECLITFGMNVGYNSCTYGATKIRSIEEQEQFNIPWTISLSLSGADYLKHKASYRSLIQQGQELGIYTWTLHSHGETYTLLELIEAFPDCAFALFCSPEEITNILLDEASSLSNLMFVVDYNEYIENACSLLRTGKFLYSISVSYDAETVDDILSGDLLSDIEPLYPSFTIFHAASRCPQFIQSTVYEYIQNTRLEQTYRTIPFELIHDTKFIDSIISNETVSVWFDREGVLHSLSAEQPQEDRLSFFHYPLRDLLKKLSGRQSA